MKVSAENGLAMATKSLKDVTALGFEQFHTSVDALQKAHPATEVFATVGKVLKSVASTMESALKTGASAFKKACGV